MQKAFGTLLTEGIEGTSAIYQQQNSRLKTFKQPYSAAITTRNQSSNIYRDRKMQAASKVTSWLTQQDTFFSFYLCNTHFVHSSMTN